jgi:hypothetical protein
MKRIYSLVWNRAPGRIVVAPKRKADRRGGAAAKVSHTGCRALIFLAFLAGLAAPLPVLAGDTCEESFLSFPSSAPGSDAFACGTGAKASGADSTALGNAASSSGVGSTAVGYQSYAGGALSTALGGSSNAFGAYSTALGYASYAGDHATSIGLLSDAGGDYSAALGFDSHAGGDYSVAVGAQARATGGGSVALGMDAAASSDFGIALGGQANASGWQSVALGAGATASSDLGIALGVQANASGRRSMALGFRSIASGDYSTASGGSFDADGDGMAEADEFTMASGVASSAFGAAAQATADNSVALGASSIADRANSVSVGSSGSERQIVNVAAATANTDAVNLGQVMPFATFLGGGASFAGGVFVAPVFTIQDVDYGDVGSAFAAVDAKLTDLYSGGGTGVDPDRVSYDDSSHASITLSDGHGTVVTNVADGVAAGDAVNKGQLDAQTRDALDSAQTYADLGDNATLGAANAYTDARISKLAGGDFDGLSRRMDALDLRVNALDEQVATLDDRIGRVAALGAALAMTAPDARIPGDNQLGVGVGTFRGHSAVGIGYSRMLGRSAALRVGAAVAGHGDNSVGAGINFGW